MSNKESKQDIKIIDYGVLFEMSLVLIIIAIDIPLIIIDIQNLLTSEEFYRFETFRVIALILVLISLLYVFFLRDPKIFNKNKSYFSFTDKSLKYNHFGKTSITNDKLIEVPLSEIDYIDYCVVSELQDRYGRLNKLSSWQLYRKSSIGVHIGKITLYFRYLIPYLFLILPYKIWRFNKTNEKYNLLYKNLFICLKNRNYLAVNIYSNDELIQLLEFFNKNEIYVRGKTHFIPHLQNQGWFVDKEEQWTEDFKQEST